MTVMTSWDASGWRRALVYGFGASGRAASRLLLGLGVEVVAVDAREAEALGLATEGGGLAAERGFELRAGAEPAALPAGIDAVVVSPGVPLDRPLLEDARRRGVPVLAEVELAFPYLDGPVAAVTGSNGKSTTTALAGAMLREAGFEVAVCGNIGPPLSAQVDRARLARGGSAGGGPVKVYVVELSSFQLLGIHAFRPRAAAFLNLAPDHLDRHGGLDAYAAAKRRIFENQGAYEESGDVAVLNADDPVTRATEVRSRRRLFSRSGPVADGCFLARDGRGERVIEVDPIAGGEGEAELFRPADSPLPGAHNLENAMAAALLASALGASADDCRRALASFRGLPHRMERVTEAGGVAWFDDSKGTNPAATLGCLQGFDDGTVHLVLGGRGKGADFRDLAPTVARKARHVYLIGEAAGEIEDALQEAAGAAVPLTRAGTLERAVADAAARARPGEVVLLSPACASFDQFRDFNHRGEVFQRLVRATVGGARGQEARV
ncbi:MAG TPA: UDP-N-acetylmuramoyl-L-alanine--D-glutamate ligase [Thermoanaerobaculia bacterium]|nr:UDP-N-acetylmuramoyl-L-alanine--D-glutamate ligase [Thermoanaerobaculia bacterium]